MKRRDTITAVCFLTALAAGLLLLASAFFGGEGHLVALLKEAWSQRDPQAVRSGAESAVNQDLDRDHLFIQLYGGVQRAAGRRVVEDVVSENSVVKLSTGALNFVNLQGEPQLDAAKTNAAATAEFARELAALGVPYRFVLAPQKIRRGERLVPAGVEEYGNQRADAFLTALAEGGGAYTDLRPLFEGNGVYEDWFFRTDHHWRPEGAFFAWQSLAELFVEEYGFLTDPAVLDEANWEKTVLEEFFLGSQGKRVGSLYAGTDDFTLYKPKFSTDLTYTCPFYAVDRAGPFERSVCFPERVEQKDWFEGNPYVYYAGGDYPQASIVNHKNPAGPKIVLLRDSFACALTPFLALSCSELVTIDLRYFQGSLAQTVSALEPDLVLTLYTAGTTGNTDMFRYK